MDNTHVIASAPSQTEASIDADIRTTKDAASKQIWKANRADCQKAMNRCHPGSGE